MKGKYDDIIGLTHHISPTRAQMSAHDRAAQFSPFAALTGYDAQIKETARLTYERTEPDEYILAVLDNKMRFLKEQTGEPPAVIITCFKADEQKPGGEYISFECKIVKVDEVNKEVVTQSGEHIPICDITDIEGDVFDQWVNNITNEE